MNGWFVQASAEECSLHQITINAELGSAHGFDASTDRGELHTQSCIDFWQGDRSTHGFGFGSEKRGQVCTSMLKRFRKRGQVHTQFQTAHTWSSWSPARLVRWRVIVTLLGCCWHQASEGKKDRAAFGATRDVWYFIGALQCGEPNIRRGFTLCWAHVIAVSINVVSRGLKTSGTNSLACITLAVWCCQAMLPCWHLSTMNSLSEKSQGIWLRVLKICWLVAISPC